MSHCTLCTLRGNCYRTSTPNTLVKVKAVLTLDACAFYELVNFISELVSFVMKNRGGINMPILQTWNLSHSEVVSLAQGPIARSSGAVISGTAF